jgi:flagellar basal body-associated protein FliL
MTDVIDDQFKNPEKRGRLLKIAWAASLLMIVLGYIIIFYVLFFKK